MLTKEELAEVHEAIDRLAAAERSLEALLNTERDRDMVNNPRVTVLRNVKGGVQSIVTEIEKLYA